MEDLTTHLIPYVKGTWKYRWYGVVAIWFVAIIGWLVVHELPDNYESSARIYVDTESVLKPLLAGMAQPPNVEQQVTIMSRTLISRPNVERVIRMVDLDLKTRTAQESDQLVQNLMDDIEIEATGRDNLFTISYANEDRRIAKGVVQSLLTIFVEGSLRDSKQNTVSAIRFIDEQIKEYEQKLLNAETALKTFKQKNMGIMPRQNRDFATQLGEVSDNLNQARLELKEAEQARDALKSQIAGNEPDIIVDEAPVTMAATPEIDERIQSLNKHLDSLRLQYTEQHPDIVGAKRLIKQLEERKKEETKLIEERQREEAKQIQQSGDPGKNYSPMLQQLNVALAEAEARVASMRARVEEFNARFNQIRSMGNAVPEVEAALAQLNRDYEVNKANYEKLLERREAAKMSGDMRATTELMTFRIIDPPTDPQTPTGPNRGLLYSLVLVLALASGVGVAFMMSQINPTFHSQSSLRETTGRPILGTVAMMWTGPEIVKRRKKLFAFCLSLLLLLGLYGTLMATMAPGIVVS
ncbi:MAG TPA: XrtA system polysaccharide chain length determinant [Methylophilaceae bacterium]|jgi:polysaccharide chain length determinant protein (PEP-CTERM system associated)|nr:XrtA system polysaccharide chain length determinant [Methylophilaceae bacterium]